MIILGVVCLILGYLLGIPVLVTVGWILLVIGVVLFVLAGRSGGRRYY